MRISQDTVQRILQAADVVDVVGDFVPLKKRGTNMVACCPFHNEKSPSFSVSPTKGIYKCFGCGKAGDSVRFIMDIEGIGYPEALRYLAKKYGIEVEEKEYTDIEANAQNERESLYIVLEFAQKFYQNFLFENEIGKAIGKEYFKERGFTESTIKTFGLGYSPENWDIFTKQALNSGFTIDILEKAGLSISKEGKDPIDRFRGRVIFPIHNIAGKPIAFGARILKKDPNAAKYINSPETAVYHKSNIVYGIYHAKNAIRQEDNCYLVEGYTDVVAMHQAGVVNVVASSGTALTKEQIQLIRRFTHNITVLYDGDAAGIKASLRGIDIILEEGMDVKAVVFPDGDDPDSFIRNNGNLGFKEYVKNNAQDLISFKTEISLQVVGNDPIKRAALISDLVESITKIPDAIKRSVFFKEVSLRLGIEEQILITESNKIARKNIQNKEKERQNNISNGQGVENSGLGIGVTANNDFSEFETQRLDENLERKPLSYHEEECVRLLVCYGSHVIEHNTVDNFDIHLADYIFQELNNISFETPKYDKILNIFREKHKMGEILEPKFFTSHEDSEIQNQAIHWLASPYQISENWVKKEIYVPLESEKLPEMAYTNILRLKKTRFKQGRELLLKKLDNAIAADEQLEIMTQMMKIDEMINLIANELGTVVQA